jgi:hypothetical protein
VLHIRLLYYVTALITGIKKLVINSGKIPMRKDIKAKIKRGMTIDKGASLTFSKEAGSGPKNTRAIGQKV